MSAPSDQLERDRFITQHGRNISVIAAAGVGKTRAIVERIVSLASLPEDQAVARLSSLIVVTYSVRAAQEMQLRARAAIRQALGISPRVLRAFQQTFFGTIHSYCVRLLDRFGHYLGLASSSRLLESDDELWSRFLTRGLNAQNGADPHLHELVHFYSPERLYALGRTLSPGLPRAVGPMPVPRVERLLVYDSSALKGGTRKAVGNLQLKLKIWSEAWARGDRFHPLPKTPDGAATEFNDLWIDTFAPLQNWLREATLAFGRQIANAYETFRLGEGVMTYEDQVRLALRVLENPHVRRELAEDRLSVLLDEAQDTDFRQFEVLLRVAGLRSEEEQLLGQTFCIVGDFQQAIFAPRSDLAHYQEVHHEVSTHARGGISSLQVTFRCDAAIIRFVNAIFESLLDKNHGQAAFTELKPRHDAGPGQVARWTCPPLPPDPENPTAKHKTSLCEAHEARFVGQEIARRNRVGMGVQRWQEIAVLCPRVDWLIAVERELNAAGVPTQIHFGSQPHSASTPRAWLTSLIWIAAHPEDIFEIAGALREILGVSDHDMALFTAGHGDRLRLDLSTAGNGPVPDALRILQDSCANAQDMPLHLAIEKIVTGTRLMDRLLSIHDEDANLARQELDDFLGSVLHRSAKGATLVELADELRTALPQTAPADDEVRDAVQLLTSYKAKGLEWPTVVVPFLFRNVSVKATPYPRLVQLENREEIIVRDYADYQSTAHDYIHRREKQQLQRLLYVTCTRPRQNLLFIDDEELFANARRQSGLGSSAEALQFIAGRPNRLHWQALDLDLTTVSLVKPPPSVLRPTLEVITSFDFDRAIVNAAAIPRRVTPHALAEHSLSEFEPERRLESEDDRPSLAMNNPGTRYGTWWHQLVETVPWQQPMGEWKEKFRLALPHSPQPERSTKEWNLFLQSELSTWLAKPGRFIHTEFPFLWPESKEHCLEGVMDLTIYTPDDFTWRVIDWKTNHVGQGGSPSLIKVYRAQIDAYLRALREILKADVRGSLYLTVSGEWITL